MALQDDINSFGSSNTATDLLVLSACTANVTNNRVVSVATVNDLPNLVNDTVEPGTVFFVDSLQIPVVAQIGCWTGLDNRELRNDFDTASAWSWGYAWAGALGDGTTTNKSSPVLIAGNFIDWTQIQNGFAGGFGLRGNRTLWSWGCNNAGSLGQNNSSTVLSISSPAIVAGNITDWCRIYPSKDSHRLAQRSNGTLWAWGRNSEGQIGDGTIANRSSPVSVAGGFTDWISASASTGHSAGVRANGTLWTWGFNARGELGDNTVINKSSPVTVVGGFTDWRQVSIGNNHTLAIRANGTLWTWGCNSYGQLGDGTVICRSSPVSVVGGFTNWCQVDAGYCRYSIGLRSDGTLWSWGRGISGILGDGTVIDKSSPVSVVGGFTDWCQVSAGGSHVLALRTNGTIWSWGYNSTGALGTSNLTTRSSPVSVVGGFTDWCQVNAGRTCQSSALRRLP